MKSFLIIVLFFTAQYADAMGIFPINQRFNDMGETSKRINMFSDQQGYEDQQMLEENPQLEEDRTEQTTKTEQENGIKDEQLPPEEKIPSRRRSILH